MLRLPSIAGNGLPERMRTTAFAFLGLTAALGLALVATFAQLSFPVLSPAPAPSGPLGGSAVSDAVALDRGPAAVPARGRQQGSRNVGVAARGGSAGDGAGDRQAGSVTAPDPAPAPAPMGQPSGSGGVPSAPVPAPTPAPAPTPSPAQPPPSVTQPEPEPAGPAKPKPTPARPAAPEPAPAPAPGNSQSSAAAEHASERGVEASSKSSAAVAPEAAAGESPGNGKGKALGHDD